jgi:hypothetical protein
MTHRKRYTFDLIKGASNLARSISPYFTCPVLGDLQEVAPYLPILFSTMARSHGVHKEVCF